MTESFWQKTLTRHHPNHNHGGRIWFWTWNMFSASNKPRCSFFPFLTKPKNCVGHQERVCRHRPNDNHGGRFWFWTWNVLWVSNRHLSSFFPFLIKPKSCIGHQERDCRHHPNNNHGERFWVRVSPFLQVFQLFLHSCIYNNQCKGTRHVEVNVQTYTNCFSI